MRNAEREGLGMESGYHHRDFECELGAWHARRLGID
jgi:hypothetical protein